MESPLLSSELPGISPEALETFAELLSQVEAGGSSDAFYSRLCEAVCRLASMDRAVIFRFDDRRQRVRAAGSYGIPLELFADAHVTVRNAPPARRALEEDRVIEVDEDISGMVPPRFRDLVQQTALVCTPMSGGGRWLGVILSDRGADRPPLAGPERHLLWTLGKMAAMAAFARMATNQQAQSRQLQERIDLAREIHESVIQRLFGVQLVFASQAELDPAARERIGAELQAALADLRRALQRPLGRSAPETQTTLIQEVARIQREQPRLGLVLAPGAEAVRVPDRLQPLAQSVLAEAARNAHKHADTTRMDVALSEGDGALVLEVVNNGVRTGTKPRQTGMGLRLAALEALQAGGIVEFGEREPGFWRVRLTVPHDGS